MGWSPNKAVGKLKKCSEMEFFIVVVGEEFVFVFRGMEDGVLVLWLLLLLLQLSLSLSLFVLLLSLSLSLSVNNADG